MKSKLPEFYVIVHDEATSREVQLKLFLLGYYWCGDSSTVQYTDREVLWVDEYCTIAHSDVDYLNEVNERDQDTVGMTAEEFLNA